MRNQKHAERRALIEAERAERRRLEEERLRKRSQRTRSKETPATWRLTGGIKIAGVAVRGGMFYTGHNLAQSPKPHIEEPSMLDPTYSVAASAEKAERLGAFPCYQTVTDEQRRGYIEFLASDRTKCEDIGYVFMYFYGFERRLVIDSMKPGEVGAEEREKLTREMLRLLNVFGNRSRSLAHYIGMLLLYDGTVFDICTDGELDAAFHRGQPDEGSWMKRFEQTENFCAMSYMMAARLIEHGRKLSNGELAALAKAKLLSSDHFHMTGLSRKSLFDDSYDRLLANRLAHVDISSDSLKRAARAKGSFPDYCVSSPTIRHQMPLNTAPKCRSISEAALPVKALGDIALAARKDLDVLEEALASPALRGIDSISFDTLTARLGDRNPLAKHLAPKTAATYVPMSLFEESASLLGVEFAYTSKGLLTQSAQDLIAQLAASCGWQAVLPDIVRCRASIAWKYGADTDIVLFKRGTVYDVRSGQKGLGALFGKDEKVCEMTLPGNWDVAVALAYIFAWFVKNSPESLSSADVTSFSSKHYPPFAVSGGSKKNQIALFFSVMYATYGAGLSTHGIKNCLDAVSFSAVQDLMFSVCMDKFGNLVPQDVMEAMEKLYERAGIDKSLVLYDYHAGDFRVSHDDSVNASEFSIDEARLARTISSTSDVHTILNDAMVADDEAESNTVPAKSQVEPAASVQAQSEDSVLLSEEKLSEIFGGGDEMPTSALLDAVKDALGFSTSAEAMSAIARINEELGDVIEIDGADAYLDI